MAEEAEGTYRVGKDEGGLRLDLFLKRKLGCSRSEVRRLLRESGVRVDGRLATEGAKGQVLSKGEEIEVTGFHPTRDLQVEGDAALALQILGQGSGWIALDKPAGVPVHPLRAGERGTLLGALALRFPEIQGVGEGGLRSGVVHRLDLGTSGAILFATEQTRWEALRAAFSSHRVQKRYRALVEGRLEGSGREELWLRVAQHRPARVRVADEGESDAFRTALSWQSLAAGADRSLVEVRLETGFLHQVRVAMAHGGHPVLGDTLYGAHTDAGSGSGARPMLHAARLAVDEIDVRSSDPPDFAAALAELKEGGA